MNPYQLDDDKVYYAKSKYGQNEIDAVVRCLQEGWLGPGKYMLEFETAIARIFGKEYGVMVNSGSSALMLAAELLEVQPGDEIVTAATGFPTTINPFLQKGATVVLVDVNLDTLSPNLEQLEAAITPKTKAIVVAHILGATLNMESLRSIADRHGVKLIEDSCDSLGALYNGISTGHYSDMSVTSTYPTHIITACGGGGMLCVNTGEEQIRAKTFRDWGRSASDNDDPDYRFNAQLDGIQYDSKFVYGEIGYNLKATEVQAAFGLVQLKRLAEWNRERQDHYNRLRRIVSKWGDVVQATSGSTASWLAFPFLVEDRANLAAHLEANNIQTRPIFAGNFVRHHAYRGARLRHGELPNADTVVRNGMAIGLHPDADINKIEEAFRAFYG